MIITNTGHSEVSITIIDQGLVIVLEPQGEVHIEKCECDEQVISSNYSDRIELEDYISTMLGENDNNEEDYL